MHIYFTIHYCLSILKINLRKLYGWEITDDDCELLTKKIEIQRKESSAKCSVTFQHHLLLQN